MLNIYLDDAFDIGSCDKRLSASVKNACNVLPVFSAASWFCNDLDIGMKKDINANRID